MICSRRAGDVSILLTHFLSVLRPLQTTFIVTVLAPCGIHITRVCRPSRDSIVSCRSSPPGSIPGLFSNVPDGTKNKLKRLCNFFVPPGTTENSPAILWLGRNENRDPVKSRQGRHNLFLISYQSIYSNFSVKYRTEKDMPRDMAYAHRSPNQDIFTTRQCEVSRATEESP
jgi:hypothetical protein